MNQVEVVHASWENRDQSNQSLLDVAYMDIRDSVLLEANLEAYKKGDSFCGRGPSFAQKNYQQELNQAACYGREIEELGAGNTVDGTSGHCPPEKIRKKGKSKKAASSSSQSHPGKNKTASKISQSATRSKPPETVFSSPFQFPIISSSESFQPNYYPPLHSNNFHNDPFIMGMHTINNNGVNSGTIYPRPSTISTMQLPSTSTSTSSI